jgi:hypothetical protein
MKVMCKILFPDGTVGTTMGRIIEMLFCEDTTKRDMSSQKSDDDNVMIDILERGVPIKVLARVSERNVVEQRKTHLLYPQKTKKKTPLLYWQLMS